MPNGSAIVAEIWVGTWPSRNMDLEKCYDTVSWRKKEE